MPCLKRGVVGLSVLMLFVWLASPAWSQDSTGTAAKRQRGGIAGRGGAKVGRGGGGKVGKGNPNNVNGKKNRGQDNGPAGLVEAAIARLTTLPDDVQTKVADALKTVKDKAAEDAKQLADKRNTLRDQLGAETDPAKKKDLRKQNKDVARPTGVQNYQAAKAALKDILSADQLRSLDTQARAIMTESAGKLVHDQVDVWVTKDNIELSADENTKIDAAVGTLKDAIASLDPGDQAGVKQAVFRVISDIRANVLTDEQRSKVPAGSVGKGQGGKGGGGGKRQKGGDSTRAAGVAN